MAERNVITPETVEWSFTAPKDGVTRVFYQSELTIDGEVAILSLVSRSLTTLAQNNVPLSMFSELQLPDGSLDFAKANDLITSIAPYLPNVAAESTAILFGYYPTDEMGRRAKDYDDAVAFIRASLKTTRWLDILNVFTDQNDWKRMYAPFVGALKKGVTTGLILERDKARTT